MQLGEITTTVPSILFFNKAIGFNVENLKYENLHFQAWDLGGQTQIRSLKFK